MAVKIGYMRVAGYILLDYERNLDIMKELNTSSHGIHRKLKM
jgi:hypothetical protein